MVALGSGSFSVSFWFGSRLLVFRVGRYVLTGGNAFLPNAGGIVIVFVARVVSPRDSLISFCFYFILNSEPLS